MAVQDTNIAGSYPEGDELQKFIKRRNTGGLVWRIVFLSSTVIAIIALTALLYNIINSSFGYVAVQNKVDPAALVLAAEEERMLAATNITSSEDDNELVDGITGNPNAVGFFGYAYFKQNSEALRAVTIDGVAPTAETAESGEYPLARPLFIYTSAGALQEKSQISNFIAYYLMNVNSTIEEVGYFPVSDEVVAQSKQAWLEATGVAGEGGDLPAVDPAGVPAETISVTGSSTVYPLTRQIAIQFRREGFQGGLDMAETGTTAGFAAFCKGEVDIVNASRPITRAELEACRKNKLEPVEFMVGADALAVVVSTGNDFLQNVTQDELREIFTGVENWSEINPDWPDTPVERFIPGADSGTLDFFAGMVFDREFADLEPEVLIEILENTVSAGLLARFESEQPLAERDAEELRAIVVERVVRPDVVRTWDLSDSIFNRAEIADTVATIPQGELEFRSWLHTGFLTTPQSSTPEAAGIRTAILGSLWTIFITMLVALPIGVGAAIYLEEYAAGASNPILRRINAIIQTNINNLAGVPSIIYGMLGLAIFVRVLEPITSGTAFGVTDPTTANGRTIISAGLTLALLILPLIIINAQEAIRAVPQSLRQAGMGLGATKWQTIWAHVLPSALPGILTGNILAISRAIGETAPLVVVGASTFITVDPTNPFDKFTTLPIQIYQWTARPQDEFRNIAAAAIIVLLVLLLTLNASAILLRNRYSRRLA